MFISSDDSQILIFKTIYIHTNVKMLFYGDPNKIWNAKLVSK